MSKTEILESYPEEEFIFMDGFDDAIIGIASRIGMNDVIAYSTSKIIEILMGMGMVKDEAQEYFDFNIIGSYVGERTPTFISF